MNNLTPAHPCHVAPSPFAFRSPFFSGHFDQICALTSLTAAPDTWPLHLKFPRLCKSLCRLMPQIMQIQFLPLRLQALKGRWVLTSPANSYVSSHRFSHNCCTQCCSCGKQRDGKQFQYSKCPFFFFFNKAWKWHLGSLVSVVYATLTHLSLPYNIMHPSNPERLSNRNNCQQWKRQPVCHAEPPQSRKLGSGSNIAKVEQSSAIKSSLP